MKMKNMKKMTLLGLLLAAPSYIKAPEAVESPDPETTGGFLQDYDGAEGGPRDGTYYAERGSGDTQGGSRGSDTATYTSGAGGKGGSSGRSGNTTPIQGAGTGMGDGQVIDDTTAVARKGLGTDGSANSPRISTEEFNQALNGSISDASTVELNNVTQAILDPLKKLYASVHDSSRANASDEAWYQSFFRQLKELFTGTPSKANIMEDGQQLSTLAYNRLVDITTAIGKEPLETPLTQSGRRMLGLGYDVDVDANGKPVLVVNRLALADQFQKAGEDLTEARALLSTTVALRARVEEFVKNNPEAANAPDFVKFRESIRNDAMSCRTLIEQVHQRYLDVDLLNAPQGSSIAEKLVGAIPKDPNATVPLQTLVGINPEVDAYVESFNATYGSRSVAELNQLGKTFLKEINAAKKADDIRVENIAVFKGKLLNKLIEARTPKPTTKPNKK